MTTATSTVPPPEPAPAATSAQSAEKAAAQSAEKAAAQSAVKDAGKAAASARAAAALKAKMSTATLVGKQLYAGDRLGIFTLRPDAPRWPFQAGQYTTLGLETANGFIVRPYSIASSPLEPELLEFSIAQVDGGQLTPTLFAQPLGATFHLLSPKGRFTLRQADRPVWVMIATGTGLAPFMAQIRTLWRQHQAGIPVRQRIILFHGVAHGDEFGYRDELDRYAAARADGFDLTYVRTCSRPDPARGWDWSTGQGRVNDLLRLVLGSPLPPGKTITLPTTLAPDDLRSRLAPTEAAFLLCGNPGMIDDLRDPLAQAGASLVLTEEFWKGEGG